MWLSFTHVGMETFWHIIGWAANTMIFLLAGLIVGSRCTKSVDPSDVASVFIIYVTLFIIRLLMLILFAPLMHPLTQGHFGAKNIAFMTFAGLRGAVSLALVLIFGSTTQDIKTANRVIFIVSGVVFLTTAINATLSEWLLITLGITHGSSSTDEQIIFHYVTKRLR
jgi:sodium/hydrogen exchanger 10/11